QDIVLGQLDAERVDQIAIDEDFEMQVRARGLARRADIADHLALPDAAAHAKSFGVARHMTIGSLVAIDVLDFDLVPVARLPLVIADDAVTGGVDGRAAARGQVDTRMELAGFEDGVDPVAEARTQRAAALKRPAIKEALAGFSIRIVEVDHAIVGGEAIELALGARERQAHIEQFAIPLGAGLSGLEDFDRIA